MKIGIIKYNAGNVFSVYCALKRLGVDAVVTENIDELNKTDKIIFPGVGSAKSAMEHLKKIKLDTFIKDYKNPFLGICLGLQLLCEYSEEGDTDCLGIFPISVKKFQNLKVPQIGWNTLEDNKSLLYKGINNKSYVYFVHSYYAPTCEWTITKTNYDIDYSSSLKKNNFYAVQYHPEKSADIGEKILKNFVELC